MNDILKNYKNYINLNDSPMCYYFSVARFIDYCKVKKIDYIKISFGEFAEFFMCLKNGKLPMPKNFNGRLVNASLNVYLFAIRHFYRYLLYSDLVSKDVYDVILKLKRFKTVQTIPTYFTLKELRDIISEGITFATMITPSKLKALLYFMFYTGLRRGEILNLRRDDINLLECNAIVRGPTKSKKERVVLYPETIKDLLVKYFVTEKENQNAFNVTRAQFLYLFKFLNNFSPSGKRFTPHCLRHSFAMMLAEKNVDIKSCQKLMGHANIKTTEIYYNPTIDMISKVYRQKVK